MSQNILVEKYNPVFKRREVRVLLGHEGSGTPSRVEARKRIAAKLKEKPERVHIIKMETATGMNETFCDVEVYDDPSRALKVVRGHLRARGAEKTDSKKEGGGTSEDVGPKGQGEED